jgi:hypothetical protein
MKYLIYTIKSPSNKIYLGVTNNFVRRMAEHKYYWLKNPQSIALHNSFSKYGFESHFKEIMIDNLDRKTAYSLEEKLINDMNLLDSKIGLNSRKGGSGGNIIDWNSQFGLECKKKISDNNNLRYNQKWNILKPIIVDMLQTHTHKQICSELQITKTSLQNFLNKNKLKIKRKRKFNIEESLKKFELLKSQGYTHRECLELTNLSNGTICRYRKLKEIDSK